MKNRRMAEKEEEAMTLTERKTNPAVMDMFAQALTEREMEQVIGGCNGTTSNIFSSEYWEDHDFYCTGRKIRQMAFGFELGVEVEWKCRKCGKCAYYKEGYTPGK